MCVSHRIISTETFGLRHPQWTALLWLLLTGCVVRADTTLVLYPNTPGFQTDGKITGSLNGRAAPFEYQYTRHPDSQGQKDFKANFVRFAADGPVNVQLVVNNAVNSAALRTVGKDLPFTRSGANFQFTLPGPGNYYLQLPDLNTAGKITYTVFLFFDDLAVYNAYQSAFAAAKNVTSQGVVSHATQNQTSAVQAVLNGRGAIYFPSGVYRTGQLTINSDTTVYLAPGALLKGIDNYNTSHFLYAIGAQNVRIAGLGVIDANGFAPGNLPTKGHAADLEAVTNLKMEDLLVRDSNSWMLHVRRCDQVQFTNLKLFSGKDGIDPDGTRDMTARRTVIQSIDDGFAVKSKLSGRSCERVTLRDCIVFSCASSLKIGTENYYGVVKDITWDGCDAVDADRGCILYTNADQGVAPVSNITWRNIRIFNFPWSAETGGAPFEFHNDHNTSISNLLLENIIAYPRTGCSVRGPVGARFRNVLMNGSSAITTSGMTFEGVLWPGITSQSRPVVFIEPSSRNQNEYFNGDQVVVTVQHPFGKTISRVELLADGQSIGVLTAAPWRFTLNGLATGERVLTAKATDASAAENTTAPKRILIRQTAVPAVVSNAISAATLLADENTSYSVTLQAADADGAADLVDMRIILDIAGEYSPANGRANLAWGLNDADITHFGGQWTMMGNAAGGGRWAWRLNDWGSNTYITPVGASTSTSGNQRTVVFVFKVKSAWAPAPSQGLRSFVRDVQNNATNWVQSPSRYDVVIAPGDFDFDNDVDQTDFGHLQDCYTGPGSEQTDPACMNARLDGDVDVDLDDFAIFERCRSGESLPADSNCASP